MERNVTLLFAACAVLALLIVALLILLLRESRKVKALRGEVEHQRERVETRRKKIFELREVIRRLESRMEELQQRLRESRTPEELRTHYGRMIDALVRIYQQVNAQPMQKDCQEQIVKDIGWLSELLSTVFGVKNEVALPWTQEQAKAEEAPGEKKAVHSGARILLVDDNRGSITQLSQMLEINGYWVEKAESGEEALEKFTQSRDGYYSLVFMDIVLSGISGYETAREIRRMYRSDSEQTPIIALTANNFSEDMIQIQNAGMNDRIVKPLTEDRLMAVVKKWLGEGTKAAGRMSGSKAGGEEVRAQIGQMWKTLSAEEKTDAAPAEEQTSAAPAEEQTSAAPAEEQTSAAPAEEQTSAVPTDEQIIEAPVEEQTSAAPAEEQISTPPAEEQADAAPADERAGEEPVEEKKKNKRKKKKKKS